VARHLAAKGNKLVSSRPLLTLTLIARDEKPNVRRLLDSTWAFVDEVVVVDTGSTDGTLAEFKRYAQQRGEPGKLKTARFKWRDDFAAARQAADDLATGQWLVWADLDDTVNGLKTLRHLAADASDDVVAFFCRYTYAADEHGNAISELWRERVVRNNGTRWTGRLHEHKLFTQGAVVKVGPEMAEWIHHRDHAQRTGARNLRILEQWDRDEPENPRIVSSIAMEYMGMDRHKDASDAFARYLALPGEPADRRAQATRHMCVMLMMQNRVEDARSAALDSLRETWLWADTHLTLAEAEQTLGRPDAAAVHAETAMRIGQPDTLLIINPLQYTAHPRALLAVCMAQMGRFDEAVKLAEEALRIAPSYQLAAQHIGLWRGQLKKQQTLATWLASADVLAEVGELIKARELLDRAPFFICEEPQLIGRRVEIARRITERLSSAKVPAEDPVADAFVERHLAEAA
jgi:tetratricopeptide (TPR) repeat protein